jgi:hypothetical protein
LHYFQTRTQIFLSFRRKKNWCANQWILLSLDTRNELNPKHVRRWSKCGAKAKRPESHMKWAPQVCTLTTQ